MRACLKKLLDNIYLSAVDMKYVCLDLLYIHLFHIPFMLGGHFTTLTVIVCFSNYLVFFDGKEVISFGRVKGDFFSRVYSKTCMTIQRRSHHSPV